MRQPASLDLSLVEGTVSGWILQGVQTLDAELGAASWSPFAIAIGSAAILRLIRVVTQDGKGVRWWALLHAVVTGYGSLATVWVSVAAAETLTGNPEPLRSILCQGPLTSVHRIIPAISMGYGLIDMIEGLGHGIDFILHGFATFTIMAYFCYYDVAEIIVPMLLMEISTIHLNFVHASFLSEKALAFNMGFFVLTFFTTRLFVCPYFWYGIYTTAHDNADNPISQACLPWHFQYVAFAFGMFFNVLNAFWAYKIVLKVKRKLSGAEKIAQSNALKDR